MSISTYEFLSILQANRLENDIAENTANDYQSVLEYVRTTIAQNNAEDLAAALDDAGAAVTLKTLIMKYTAEYLAGYDYDRDELVERVYQDMAGLGLLTKYLHDPDVEEININGYRLVEILRSDRTDFLYGQNTFSSPDAALDIVKRMVRMGGKLLDAQTPQVDSFIGSGTRIAATIPPLIPKSYGVVASIRKQSKTIITREMLLRSGTASPDMLDFLSMCLCNHVSIGISGGTGSGKSSLESYLCNDYIENNEDYNNRIYLVEDTQELKLLEHDEKNDRPARVIPMLTSETPVKKTMFDLTKGALRYHPSVIVPAEVRDETVYQAVTAGQSGHTIITSFHADSARDSYRRLVSLCHMAGTNQSDEILLEDCICAWPIIVFLKQLKDNSRKIMEIFEATGQKDGRVIGTSLYRFNIAETERNELGYVTKVHGKHERTGCISPQLYSKLRDNGAAETMLKHLFPDAQGEEDI